MKLKLFALFFLAATTGSIHAINVIDGSTYSQNFNGLSQTVETAIAWANDSTLPGWSLFQSSGTAITTYGGGTGSGTGGNFWSFGSAGSSDRALGGLGSGNAYFGSPGTGAIAGWIAASFINNSGGLFSGFTAGWDGEQWRNGGNASAQAMVFEYGFGATFGAVSTWTAPGGAFDWSSPVHTATAATVDGNASGLVTGVGGSITGLNWSSGDTLWLRWVERNDTGNDHGLAIDNFSFKAQLPAVSSVPETLSFAFTACFLVAFLAFAHYKAPVRQLRRIKTGNR